MNSIKKIDVRRITLISICSSLTFLVKLALVGIPNIEMVTFLLIIFTLVFKLGEALFISTTFTFLEIFVWGLSEQFYIWTVIVLLTFVFKIFFNPSKAKSNDIFLLWSFIAGFYGLIFGFLSAIPFIIIVNINYAMAYYMSGLPFDAIHLAGNFMIMLVAGELFYKTLQRLLNEFNSNGGNYEDLY